MHDQEDQLPRLKIGSLFSGYGGLDLAVEHVFNAKTVWFSKLNKPDGIFIIAQNYDSLHFFLFI